ncbi:MFS transporter [Mycobacteroides abscessus]|nr:MFS transporter [Mycobacteroides abscessus subsp. massiliense]RIR58577.1 MFS transporter [Mycobacteroides abscessus]MBL3745446.1 MFS transporter [Mycobacteroides abscessus subsp. massiliense]MBL3758910.1 MFS transporter [Mycobacteroides abscessus subsp. massiliense]MBN7479973.1 MFS transporter [Mycobacteroides abscessus subsp. massiliense]
MTTMSPPANDHGKLFSASLVFIALVVAAVGSLGAPLITAVAEHYRVSLNAAQWTLTITLLFGAVAGPLLGRLGSDKPRKPVVLVTLAIVVIGSIATVIPAPFAVLLAGRAAQGVGLGLPVLMMATAREHLADRAPASIAMLSVASTVGIGIGYPVAGLLTQIGGVRAAYLIGLVVAGAAAITAAIAIPRDRPRTSPDNRPTDWLGAVLLSVGLITVLLTISDIALWRTAPARAALILAAGLLVLTAWVTTEKRAPRPIVDLTALRHPAVSAANAVMVVSGISMYLLFTLITRYVQTPTEAGYGYGLTDLQAGLVLVPFSALGFAAGQLVPKLLRHNNPFVLLGASCLIVSTACALFATTRTLGAAWPIIAMSLLGFGVGAVSAVMPAAILAVTPDAETAAAMSINQVVRSIGFSAGSAASAIILAAYTAASHFAPPETGFTVAAGVGAALSIAAAALAAISRHTTPTHPTLPS